MKIIDREKRMSKFLTKERELELGAVIQEYCRAEEAVKEGALEKGEVSDIFLKGELAIQEMVENNVKLVYSLASNFKTKYPNGPELEDLIQDGMIGMMTAIRKYDPARGNKFSTVAYNWINQSIGRRTNETSRMVRLPENRIVDYMNMRKIEEELTEEMVSPAEIDAVVSERLNITLEKIREIRNAAASHASLNKVVGNGPTEREFGEFFAEEKPSGKVEEYVLKNEMFQVVSEVIQSELTKQEQEVISSSFALDLPGIEAITPKEVKARYRMSHAKYSNTLKKSINTLKSNLSELGVTLNDFIF